MDIYISMDIYRCSWMSHPSKIENSPIPSPSHPRNDFSPIRSSGAGFAGICHNRSTPDNRNMRLWRLLIRSESAASAVGPLQYSKASPIKRGDTRPGTRHTRHTQRTRHTRRIRLTGRARVEPGSSPGLQLQYGVSRDDDDEIDEYTEPEED